MKVLLVGVFGAAGALGRYGIGAVAGSSSFPWPTLGINSLGSLLLGLVIGAGEQHGWSQGLVVPLTIGFLGAFTTFSTFSYEAFALLRDERAGAALSYVVLSLIIGVAAAALGYQLGRHAI